METSLTSPSKVSFTLPAISPQKPQGSGGDGSEANKSTQPSSDALPALDNSNLMASSSSSSKKKKKKKDTSGSKELVPEEEKPADYDFWVRCMDINRCIYYYNTQTGESTWLAPCSICYKLADKWCQDCSASFCDKHFAKKHNKDPLPAEGVTVSDLEALKAKRHKWSAKELPSKKDFQTHDDPNIVKCIECSVKQATKMCLECWDPYCMACFDLVHHVGSLRFHASALYDDVCKGWICIRTGKKTAEEEEEEEEEAEEGAAGADGKAEKPDRYYVHGRTKETTYDKPVELMTTLERTLLQNWKSHQAAAEKFVQDIDQLQFELEKVKYERDQLLVEKMHLLKSKEENDSAKDSKKSKAASNDAYIAKLLNPSDRKRGEARTNYIQSLLEAPMPGKK